MGPSSINNCVLLLNLPPKALAGIDLLSFTTSPRFRGVKNVLPGMHFVFAAGDAALSVRNGAWFYVTPGTGSPQVFVKRWDERTEDLVAETSQTEILSWKANLGSIWKDGLTPYRQSVVEGDSGAEDGWTEESSDWSELTSRITPTLLSRICGLNPDHWSLTSASAGAQDQESIPGLDLGHGVHNPEKELGFLPIDLRRTWRAGATGHERTEAARDRSWFLGDLIENHSTAGDERGRQFEVLGELQFTFLMVLTLNNNSCLEQWKRILELLFTCRRAVKERHSLFVELLHTLRIQLSHIGDMETSMFDMDDLGRGFLRPLFHKFRAALDDAEGKWKTDILDELDDLQRYLQREYNWQLDDAIVRRGMLELEDGERVEMDLPGADEDDESGEYAPTVVDLTSSQLQGMDTSDAKGGQQTKGSGMEEDAADGGDLDNMDMRY